MTTAVSPSSAKPAWKVPTALIILSLVPAVAGAFRVAEITGGAEITPDNARFFASPVPVLVHIVSAVVYCLLGAFQFVPKLRSRKVGWHRAAGRLLVPFGIAAALSGLWMTLFYARPVGDGELLTGFRLFFGTAMLLSIVLGFAAIRRRDIARHSAWMVRGYAIGLGAGTQVFTHVPWMLAFGVPGEFARAMLMAAGWLINLAVAEWVIRKRLAKPRRTSTPTGNPLRPADMAR